jgi:DNA-binding beta-propeller fold protein YncE
MKRCYPSLLPAVALFFLGASAVGAGQTGNPYHFIREIPIGGDGGWDYLSVDPGARRLYVSHGTKVVVIDIDKNQIVGEIAGTPGVHGFALAPLLGRGFSSNGRENKAGIVDLETLRTLAKVDTGQNPDAILYEPQLMEVYVFNGSSRSATVFSAGSGQIVASIPLPGKPEFAVADPSAGRVYDDIEDRDEVAVIDTQQHQVVATWPTAPGEEAAGLAIDLAHHRLFVGCHNGQMVMMDSATGKVIATVPIGQGVDANAFDPGTLLAFASCGDGTVTIAKEETPDRLTVVQTLATESGARTMVLDPKTHRIYLATAQFAPAPAPEPNALRRRPPQVPGSFKVLVYGMD